MLSSKRSAALSIEALKNPPLPDPFFSEGDKKYF
jgi:hypothetical protein